ncbi:MAG: InlB B-repeat-containing protein [Oscillospiraceae bacterium]|nr:InlB B-repeat-containing protein [Oscillospiraceae bacterium]
MKKRISFLIAIFLLLSVISIPVFAAGEEPTFAFELSVDGSDTKEVKTGDIITVTLHLVRTDSDEAYTMYAMQDEIRYNSEFFELIEESVLLNDGVQYTDISVSGGYRELYMTFLSFGEGENWDAKTRLGSFQLKVKADNGVSTITNEDFLISLPDGSGGYPCEANELTVILTSECVVGFESNGGTKIDSIAAVYGETINRPVDPTREGKTFEGWYKDIHLTEAWDFDNDTVKGNMTLYAKWADAPVEIAPEETPVIPNDEGGRGGNGMSIWLWILLIIIIIIICFLVYVRKKMNKGKH